MKKYFTLTKSFLASFIIITMLNPVTGQHVSEKYDLLLKIGNVNLEENFDSFVHSYNSSVDNIVDGYHYKIIQFYSLPGKEDRIAIKGMGIRFLDYIPNKAFIIAIPAYFDLKKLSKYDVRSISHIENEYKQDPYILDKNYPLWAMYNREQIDLMVTFYSDIQFTSGTKSIASSVQKVMLDDPLSNVQIVRVNIDDIEGIIASPLVYFVEPHYKAGEPENTTGKTLHRSNVLDSEYETGRHYDGTGIKVMLQDDGVIGPHIDYEGRIGAQNLTWNWGNHGDHCAGIIFGYGNLNPTVNGMAPGAELHTWGAAPEYPGFSTIAYAYNTTGIRISSTSYGDGCNAGYTSLARTMDLQIRTYESLMHVFSCGNSGTSNCGYGAGSGWANITGGHKVGKNVIAAANVGSNGSLANSSSRGPAHDGRIKPDIAAKGTSVYSTIDPNDYMSKTGTSMASPGVAGTLAQLYQAYNELNDDEDPKGGLMKAILLNTAKDLGNIGPDFKHGWGHVNALKAVQVLEEERYLTDEVDQDDNNTHEIDIPEGVKELKVMVYWTDKEASANTSKALVNDLDLTVTDDSDNEYFPWVLNPYPDADSLDKPAIKGIDNLNNMEQVQIDEPTSGTYTLNISGYEIPVGPQEYYIVYEFIMDELVLTYPIGGESIHSSDNINVRWDAYGTEGTFSVEYSMDAGENWIILNDNLSGSARNYNWNVPSVVTGAGMIRVSRDVLSDESEEPFSIMGIPDNMSVLRACLNSVLLKWDPVEEAESYDVFILGEKYMEVVGTTTTDSLWVEGLDYEEEYWYAVRAIGPDNAIGRRSIAEYKEPGVWNCLYSNDLSLSDLIFPPAGVLFNCQDFSNLPVQLEIKNLGQEEISTLDISYKFESDPVVTETYSGTLAPGETMVYEFSSTVSLSSTGNYDMEAWIENGDDQNISNDFLSATSKLKSAQYLDIQTLIDFDNYNNCVFTADCDITTCFLDNKYINFQNNLNDDIDWRALSGITPTPGTGPLGDHTTGTAVGKFLYLEASGDCYNKTAILTTPCADLNTLTNPGVSFWFNMYGEDMGSLHLDVISNGVLFKNVMEPLSGDWGEGWHEGNANLSQFAGESIMLRFRGITGEGEKSDLAIDDITVTELTGIEVTNQLGSLRVFPNPSQGRYNLVFNKSQPSEVKVEVVDIAGRIIYATQFDGVQANRSYNINISSYQKGIYYLIIHSDGYEVKEKLLKY